MTEEDLTSCTRERSFGHFRRSISQPTGIDASRISAAFEEDLLEITIQGGANPPSPSVSVSRTSLDERPHREGVGRRCPKLTISRAAHRKVLLVPRPLDLRGDDPSRPLCQRPAREP